LDRRGRRRRAPDGARRVRRSRDGPSGARAVPHRRPGPGRRPAMRTEARVEDWVGRTFDAGDGEILVEEGYIRPWLEATENANPLYWNPRLQEEITGGPVAPPSMLSVWMRPLSFRPGRARPRRPLELHFRLKEALGLPEGVVAENEMTFGAPLRPGDRVHVTESIREIGEE